VYTKLNKIDEGTFGVVYRAREKLTGDIVALKRIKLDRDRAEFPITSLREINILMSISHPNVVTLKEIVTEKNDDSVYMVMEYMDHDLKMLMRSMPQPFRQADVKCLLKQLLEGVAAMHELWILHRDLKTSNLLLNNKGILKICDFGLARKYGSPIGRYSKNVVTLYYRAPELLLGSDTYTTAIDVWSVGCIFAELLTKDPLFPGDNEFEQIDLIFKLLGSPTVEDWPEYPQLPHVKSFRFKPQPPSNLREKFPRDSLIGGVYLSDHGFNLLFSMLRYNPAKRISAAEALNHPYFTERPLPQDPSMMPTFPSLNEGGVKASLRHKLKTSTSSMNDIKHQRSLQETRGESEGFYLG
jgi:cell division cycle 2-like protein